MKSIYILLTNSTTLPSKIIYMATRSEFTHAAISLDNNFDKLYTFARKYRHLMLPAGFTRDSIYEGIMGSSDDMRCGVYEIRVNELVYKNLVKILNKIEKNQDQYRYNVLGLPMTKFNKAYEREGYFFCSQFVYHALSESGAIKKEKTPSLVRPMDLTELPEAEERFKGDIKNLRVQGVI